jgi:CheY-like chemotaxis protein
MLVELHAGQINAYSPGRNQGSSFTIELPLCPTPLDEKTNTPKAASNRRSKSLHPFSPASNRGLNAAPSVKRRVLLVEDHAPTRQTLQLLLKNRQFDVTAAKSATEALEVARVQEFALIISDVGLPDRSGFELMAELRTLYPGIPGIALSGYGMEDDLTRSQAAGFSVHLVKPVTITMLEEAIANLLSSHQDVQIS